MSDIIRVFIENVAGSKIKNIHDEKTLEFKGRLKVARAYPFPYGFILNTTNEDGGNLDCFVLTNQVFHRSDTVDCAVIGYMEQFEDGDTDHNILATPVGERAELTESVKSALEAFVSKVFSDVAPASSEMKPFLSEKAQLLKSKKITVGEFFGVAPALELIKRCTDTRDISR